MINDVEYTLLEIIEGPKRLNNIPHEKIFDYLLEAAESEDRFETFMKALEQYAPWAYVGIGIMASDVMPVAEIFKDELAKGVGEVKYRHGSVSEMTSFKMLIREFEIGNIVKPERREFTLRYFAETLAADEYAFVMGCVRQTYKKEIFEKLRLLEAHGKMGKSIREFFSFCIDRSVEKSKVFTPSCFPVKGYKSYFKIGNSLIEGTRLLSRREADEILDKFSGSDNICIVLVSDDGTPFMSMSINGAKLHKKPEPFNDSTFARFFYEGYDTFVCTSGNQVQSMISIANGGLEEKTIKVKQSKIIKMPLVILGTTLSILWCKDEDGNELSALLPDGAVKKITNGSEVTLVGINGIYYLRGVTNND